MNLTSITLGLLSIALLFACVIIIVRSKLMLLEKGFPVGWSLALTNDSDNLSIARKKELNPMEKKRFTVQEALMRSLKWMSLSGVGLLVMSFFV